MANSQQLLLHHPAHVRGAAVAAERSSVKRDIAEGRRRSGEPPRFIVTNDSNRPYRQLPRPRIRQSFTFQPPPRGTKGTSQRRDKGIPNAAAPFQPLTLTGKEKNNP